MTYIIKYRIPTNVYYRINTVLIIKSKQTELDHRN